MAMREKESRKVRDAVDRAYDDFAGRFPVAFLGTRYAGKTVYCALLKDAAARRLKRHTNGKYIGVATAGAGRINKIIDGLYDGRFPEKTPEGEAVPLTVEISSTENGTDLALIFHDMAGEEYDDLLVEEMPVEERIRQILGTPKAGDRQYGPMAHLIFAKIYVMLVDCSDAKSWNSSQAYIKDAIKSIHEIKEYIRALHNSRVPSHLAIVFSKYDTLDGGKDVGELAEELDEVDSAVTKYIGGDVHYFKSRIDSTVMSKAEVRRTERGERQARLDDAERKMSAHKNALARAKSRLAAAKDALSTATTSLDDAMPTGDAESIDSCQAAYDKAQKKYDEAGQACAELEDEAATFRSKIDELRAGDPQARNNRTRYKPDKPLSYNADEYLDLIGWMIKMARREAGH